MSGGAATAAAAGRYTGHLKALSGLEAPLAYVDLDAFEANAARLRGQAGALPIRIATKSLRCSALIQRVLSGADGGWRGAMAFTVDEALHLAESGIADDVLIAYPTAEPAAFDRLARWLRQHPGHRIRPMVDAREQVDLAAAAGAEAGVELRLCVELDTSWRPTGPHGLAIGAKRSPLRTPRDVAELIRWTASVPGARVDALMAYDAQIAGVGDRPAGRRTRGAGIALMQRRSLAELRRRIPEVVRAAREACAETGGTLELVNVGGTGSLARMAGTDGATELAAGSGLYAPTLFDAYSGLDLTAAAHFVLPVVRRPSPSVATVLGGGYVASGPPGPDRLPSPVHPPGLRLDPAEGAGEVQTPLVGPARSMPRIGERVVLRHAKAGELCERFDRLHLVRGEALIETVPTYRGEGRTFL